MRLRITAVSFFYKFLLKIVKIPEVLVDEIAIIFVWMTSSSWNLVKMCKIRFGSNIYKPALITALF